MIHVKRYGGSSLLSHLFMQGKVSADLFLNDSEFRKKVNKKLPKDFKVNNCTEPPKTRDYSICFAIMSNRLGDLHLPFFSKVTMRHTVKSLRNMGYEVYKLKINR